jgi:hypothetical protein
MRTVFSDLRYAIRQLIRNPGFTLTAVVSLALGIGATTAVFSVIYAALLNPYPYPAADRIVRMTLTNSSSPDFWADLNGPQVRQLRELPIIQNVLAMDYHRIDPVFLDDGDCGGSRSNGCDETQAAKRGGGSDG